MKENLTEAQLEKLAEDIEEIPNEDIRDELLLTLNVYRERLKTESSSTNYDEIPF